MCSWVSIASCQKATFLSADRSGNCPAVGSSCYLPMLVVFSTGLIHHENIYLYPKHYSLFLHSCSQWMGPKDTLHPFLSTFHGVLGMGTGALVGSFLIWCSQTRVAMIIINCVCFVVTLLFCHVFQHCLSFCEMLLHICQHHSLLVNGLLWIVFFNCMLLSFIDILFHHGCRVSNCCVGFVHE